MLGSRRRYGGGWIRGEEGEGQVRSLLAEILVAAMLLIIATEAILIVGRYGSHIDVGH